jgi:hypothetical protein
MSFHSAVILVIQNWFALHLHDSFMLRYYICTLAHLGFLYSGSARIVMGIHGRVIEQGNIYGGMVVDDTGERFRIGRTAVPETGTAGQSLTCLA